MNYEIIETEFMGMTHEHILIDKGNDEFESFPVDESNPRYQQFIAELEAE